MSVEYFECTCDSNVDGKVTWAELQSSQCQEAQKFATGGHFFTKKLFEKDDLNKDGALDAAEFSDVIKRCYTNGFNGGIC